MVSVGGALFQLKGWFKMMIFKAGFSSIWSFGENEVNKSILSYMCIKIEIVFIILDTDQWLHTSLARFTTLICFKIFVDMNEIFENVKMNLHWRLHSIIISTKQIRELYCHKEDAYYGRYNEYIYSLILKEKEKEKYDLTYFECVARQILNKFTTYETMDQ